MDSPRSPEQRKADALAKLTARHADLWAASASPAGLAHLVPLSFAWDGEQVTIASERMSATTRNIVNGNRARLGLGSTRDVVMIDAVLIGCFTAPEALTQVAERYAEQADWDPRSEVEEFAYLLLHPHRIQVWRKANEIPGRTIMRDGRWLV